MLLTRVAALDPVWCGGLSAARGHISIRHRYGLPGCSHSLECELVASAAEKAVRWLPGERLGKVAGVGYDRIVLTFRDVKNEPALRRMT
jgi:L-alanine-DL-glutamate epimerase-like enolase superfamily enzyme